jgi:putative FmdB family regulatory protein
MPFFDYKCPLCEHTEEHLVKLSDESTQIIKCPNHEIDECVLMEKQVSVPAGFVLVGEGFYRRSR